MFNSFYKNRRVLVTGHTGFKGSWLCEWLLSMGAEVAGYALDPQSHEILFDQLNLSSRLACDERGDIADIAALKRLVQDFQPDVVLHLAAQPLVRLSYAQPVETFATNVMGTVNLLESVRVSNHPCSIVCVTTDKCYENREWLHAYREEDAMGGHDPYSASKGAAEIAISSYRRSFFPLEGAVNVASARAGNVIGGGDWASDRIVPDCIRAVRAGHSIPVRNKIATRPWQHVLEPLSGYLHLAASLSRATTTETRKLLASAFNFGPNVISNRTVADLVLELTKHTGGEMNDCSDPLAHHEASKLNLATDKAFHLLSWEPVWNFEKTIAYTADWYLSEKTSNIGDLTRRQIHDYEASAALKAIPWSISNVL